MENPLYKKRGVPMSLYGCYDEMCGREKKHTKSAPRMVGKSILHVDSLDQNALPREPEFYTYNEQAETYFHRDLDEAIQEVVDLRNPAFAEKITIYGFAPKEISDTYREALAIDMLDYLLEKLDDDYGNFNEGADRQPSGVAAAREFVRTVINEYEVFVCEKVATIEVNVVEWCAVKS